MNKKVMIIIIVLVLIAIGGVGFFALRGEKNESNQVGTEENQNTVKNEKNNKTDVKEEENDLGETNVVLSLEDKITSNSVWCGTFNLIWNDLRDNLAEQDIEFEEQTDIVDNLNKGTFTVDELSEDSYYKVYGNPSFDLKEKIEKAIKEKFDEESDILDDFDWQESPSEFDYFLYVMLKKEFEFEQEFTKLEKGNFGDYKDVKYFGIDDTTEKAARNQVEVLYYNSKDDFAVKLFTKQNDEVIISKGNKKDSFGDIYNDILKQNEKYRGNFSLSDQDTLKIPNINIDLKKEVKEVTGKPFFFSNGSEYTIDTALQTIKFELNEKGGKIKSEAGMIAKMSLAVPETEPREFIVDDTFVIFLKEDNAELPYFASKISDITKFQ